MKHVSLARLPQECVSHNPEVRKQTILRRGDLPHLTNFSRATLKPGQATARHAHADMFEVFYVESGEARFRVGGAEHTAAAGCCVTVEPGEPHEIANAGAADLVLLYFGVEA